MSYANLSLPDVEHVLVRILQLGLAGLSLFGLVTGRIDLVLNGVIPLLLTFLPAYLRKDYGVRMDTGLVFLLAFASFVHAVGVIGSYESYPWYDQVAHALSASVVAFSGYAFVRALELHSQSITLPTQFLRVFTVIMVIAFGGLWELFELGMGTIATQFDATPPLVVFGLEDAILDLVFNAVGGVLIAILAPQYLSRLPASLASRLLDE